LRGGGFVPQSLIDSVQLTDSTMVANAKNGHKGKLFIQFSFSFVFSHEAHESSHHLGHPFVRSAHDLTKGDL